MASVQASLTIADFGRNFRSLCLDNHHRQTMEPNRVVRVVPRCLARSLIERSGRKIELRLYASVRNSQESLARKERHYYLLLNDALVGKHNIIVNQICGLTEARGIATFQRTDANRAHQSSLTMAETASTFKGWYGAASSTQPSKLITKMKPNSGSPLDAADGFDHLTRRERWNPKTPHCPERGCAPACRTFFTDYHKSASGGLRVAGGSRRLLLISGAGKRSAPSPAFPGTRGRRAMGIGIWYEMWIDDPVAFLFKNTDPRGSLRANLSNATVRCLSNMPLAGMLQTRHSMSQTVRQEVTSKSQEWGYQLGSVYIRKVHFRDVGMIRQIEEKVVNRLRQVTSAIKQAGANQVSVITSSAEREAAVEFAKAAAIRPATLGQAFQEIAREPAVAETLFEILEAQRILAGKARIALLPGGPHSRMLANLLAAEGAGPEAVGAAKA